MQQKQTKQKNNTMNTSIDGYYARVSLSFARKADTDLIAFVRNVITLMTGNAQYPSPSPTLAALTTSVNDFETKVHDALNGGKIEIAQRNASRVNILAMLRQLAAYVQGNCGEDLHVLLASGFDAVRSRSPVTMPNPPQNPSLSLTGKSGELLFKFDRVSNAVAYSTQTATNANGPWEDYDLTTTARVLIVGLTPGTVYYARACANGSAGASEWTAPTSAMAL